MTLALSEVAFPNLLPKVFATIAAWILLNQILNINNLIGCLFILIAVIFSQLLPIYDKKNKFKN